MNATTLPQWTHALRTVILLINNVFPLAKNRHIFFPTPPSFQKYLYFRQFFTVASREIQPSLWGWPVFRVKSATGFSTKN